jgi:hypothetical protein
MLVVGRLKVLTQLVSGKEKLRLEAKIGPVAATPRFGCLCWRCTV